MKIYTKIVWQWNEDGSFTKLDEDSFDYKGPISETKGVGKAIGGVFNDPLKAAGAVLSPLTFGTTSLLGGLGGSSQGQPLTQTSAPSVSPFLRQPFTRIRDEAQAAFDQNRSLVAGFTPQQEQALAGQEQLIAGGNPLLQQATEFTQQGIAGDFGVSPDVLERQFNRLRPGIQGLFGRAGGRGSILEQQALGEAFANVAAQNIQQDLSRRERLAAQAPGLAQQRFGDFERLFRLGGVRQAQEERLAGEPFQRLGTFANILNQINPGATVTQSQPTFNNPLAGFLGGALGGGQLGLGVGGPVGGLVGAGLGGLLGGFG